MADIKNISLVRKSLVAALPLLERDAESAVTVVHVLQDPVETYWLLQNLIRKAQKESEEFDFSLFDTIEAIVAAWPFDTLCVRLAIPKDISGKALAHCSQTFFKAVMKQKKNQGEPPQCRETPQSQLQCVDIRGLDNWTEGYDSGRGFEKLFTEKLPISSLPAMDVERLIQLVLSKTDTSSLKKKPMREFHQYVTDMVARIRKNNFGKRNFKFYEGRPLTVKVDKKKLSDDIQTSLFIFIHCLRHLARVKVEPTILEPECSLKSLESTKGGTKRMVLDADSHLLFINDLKYVKGMSLYDSEGLSVKKLVPFLTWFNHVEVLNIPFACKAYMDLRDISDARQAPRTFIDDLCHLLPSMPSLRKLSLGHNVLTGGLGRILDSLPNSLLGLYLRGALLSQDDLLALARSRHAKSLVALDLVGIEQVEYQGAACRKTIGPEMADVLTQFPELRELQMACLTMTNDTRMAIFEGVRQQQHMKLLTWCRCHASQNSHQMGKCAMLTLLKMKSSWGPTTPDPRLNLF